MGTSWTAWGQMDGTDDRGIDHKESLALPPRPPGKRPVRQQPKQLSCGQSRYTQSSLSWAKQPRAM